MMHRGSVAGAVAVVAAASLLASTGDRERPIAPPAPLERAATAAAPELAPPAPGAPVGFTLVSRYRIPTGDGAEILALSPDGATLVYTNGDRGTLDFVDVSDPEAPAPAGQVRVADAVKHAGAGEPTSVDITPDGRYALVVVKDTTDPIHRTDPGALVFVELATRRIAGVAWLGVGPDSLKITKDGRLAVVVIEDEEDEARAAEEQSRPGSVQVVEIDYDEPARSVVTTVPLVLDAGNNRRDPQPEYVDLHAASGRAIISLQENNAAALLDLSTDPPEVVRTFGLGTVTIEHADLRDDGEINFSRTHYESRREPDAVCFLPGGEYFVTANEGDTDTNDFIPGEWSGGGGFTVFDLQGDVVFELGTELERIAARHGMYPDTRSDDRGIEVEGCHVTHFGGRDFAIFVAERSSMVAVYDVTNPRQPRFVQLFPAPFSPEGAESDPERGLLYIGGEGVRGGGGIWIYRTVTDADEREQYPEGVFRAVAGTDEGVHFGGISGLVAAGSADAFFAAPDAAFARARLWHFSADRERGRMVLDDVVLLSRADGETPLDGYDPEALAKNPEGGFVLASEGRDRNGCTALRCPEQHRNRLVFVTDRGRVDARYPGGGIVDLPVGDDEGALDWDRLSAGFGGVALVDTEPEAPGGLVVYAAMQRPLSAGSAATRVESRRHLVRIGAYDVDAQRWRFYFYPLDPDGEDVRERNVVADLAHLGGTRFAVIERDELTGSMARLKRLYAFDLASGTGGDPRDPLEKRLLADLLAQPFRFDSDKIDGLAVTERGLMLVNDSDGGSVATFFVELGPDDLLLPLE